MIAVGTESCVGFCVPGTEQRCHSHVPLGLWCYVWPRQVGRMLSKGIAIRSRAACNKSGISVKGNFFNTLYVMFVTFSVEFSPKVVSCPQSK